VRDPEKRAPVSEKITPNKKLRRDDESTKFIRL